MAMSPAEKEMRENVRRGARLLDKHYPDWAEKVNGSAIDGLFDMVDPHHCVLGTLELVDYATNPKVCFNGVVISYWGDTQSISHGFMLSEDLSDELAKGFSDDGWEMLRDYWIEQAQARVNA